MAQDTSVVDKMKLNILKRRMVLIIKLKQSTYQIKNGYAAHSPEIGLTAHGYSVEVAKRNLERIVLMFLRPFERDGRLHKELNLLGLQVEDDGTDIKVVTLD